MKLTLSGLQELEAWKAAGISLPSYDPVLLRRRTAAAPRWIHFGAGNIFRMFLGSVADRLISAGCMDTGLICAEAYDMEIIDRIYRPFDNLLLSLILNRDGTIDRQVLAPFCEALKASPKEAEDWAMLGAHFCAPSLQMVSFTVTEKAYALADASGNLTPAASADMDAGPQHTDSLIGTVTSLLYLRYLAGGHPLALVSMDNCSGNGDRLFGAVTQMADAWRARSLVPAGFTAWLRDKSRVSFPCTMIDKITPRPSAELAEDLAAAGLEDMAPIVTSRDTYIAPFGNAEKAQYLVIEDAFPNGRPPLEKAGVFMADKETVRKAERMKVCTCLNPIHTGLCTYGCLLGYTLFADAIQDPDLAELACLIGRKEGLPVVSDPGILNPGRFLEEVLTERFPNRFLGDTSARIAVDISQMMGIRFGETIRAYVNRDGSAEQLVGIPLAIAGWLRYLLAVDDTGNPMELSPDPMLPELRRALSPVQFGNPESVTSDVLSPLLSNERIFGLDLRQAGIAEKITELLREETAGPGAVRRTLRRALA